MEFIEVLVIHFQIVGYMMIKYLETENASFTIEYAKETFTRAMLKNLNFIDNAGFKRLFIVCDSCNLYDLSNDLRQINFKKIPVFIKIKNFNNNQKQMLKKISRKYYIIICCNIKSLEMLYSKNYYYDLTFDYDEADDVIYAIEKYNNLLLNIKYDMNNINKVNDSLKKIVQESSSEKFDFMNYFLNKQLIYDCPYNIYLNNKNSNRKYGKNIPRNLFVSTNGDVYCTEIICPKIIIGNLLNKSLNNILESCFSSNGYKKFIKYNEILFIDCLNQCSYQTIDYLAFLNEVIKYYE